MPSRKKVKCVRCKTNRTQFASGVCQSCRDDPKRYERVTELAEALAWAKAEFGKQGLREGDGYSVTGAAKVLRCIRAIEAKSQRSGLQMPTLLRGVCQERDDDLRELPCDGRTGTGKGYPSVHASTVAKGICGHGVLQADCSEEGEGTGENPEVDYLAISRNAVVQSLDCQRTGISAQRCGSKINSIRGVGQCKGREQERGKVDLFTFDWPIGTIFKEGERVTLPCGNHGRVINAWEQTDSESYRYLVLTDLGRKLEADEYDIDRELPYERPQTTRQVAGGKANRHRRKRTGRQNHPDLFGATA